MTAVLLPTDIRFPPWPSPPQGVSIIPFKDYAKREIGIKLTCPNPDRIEVDGLDIPTVALEHPHATDKCKTDAYREECDDIIQAKKRKIKSLIATDDDIKLEWWQIWATEEAGKFTGPYDPKTPAIDRLCQAATDFRISRTWPPGEPRQLSPTKLFNQFGVFIGLQAIIPTWIRADRRKREEALKDFKDSVETSGLSGTQDEEFSDGEDEDHVTGPDAAPVGLQNGDLDDQKNQDDGQSEAEAAAIQEENERKDDRLLAFLDNPETIVKMFLSSYMRKEGLVWADSNLVITPRLLYFFLRYILRNRLLPEYEAGLKNALAVVERAQVELPRTSVVAKLVPCEVALALRDQYGSKAAQFKLAIFDEQPVENPPDDGNVADDDDENEDEPALEESAVDYVGDGEYVDGEQPTDEGIAKIEEVTDDNEPVTYDGYNGWQDQGWGDVPMEVDTSGVWDTQGTWNDSATMDDATTVDWTSPIYSLQEFLGIETLPIWYTTGVVEDSVRKIVSVHLPAGTTTTNEDQEPEFESKLGRIVLAPWNNWDIPKEDKGLDEVRRVYSEIYRGRRLERGIRRYQNFNTDEAEIRTLNAEELYDDEYGRDYSESSNPKIVWESSTGWVVDPDSTNGDVLLYSNCTIEKPAPAPETSDIALYVHDPSKDTIEVLVDPAVVENLKDVVGMGLGGTFVQLVNTGIVTKRYWYAETLSLVIPSFYVA